MESGVQRATWCKDHAFNVQINARWMNILKMVKESESEKSKKFYVRSGNRIFAILE